MQNPLESSNLTERTYECKSCDGQIQNVELVFQGIHIGLMGSCESCGDEYFFDLKIGHSIYAKLTVNITKKKLYGNPGYVDWYGKRLLESLLHPNSDDISLSVTIKDTDRTGKTPILVNCIDPTFTHVLFKSLNAKLLNESQHNYYVILLIPPNIRWMVPEYVDEIWQVNLPLSKLSNFYTDYNKKIHEELSNFDSFYLSHTVPEPRVRDITDLTGVDSHDFASEAFRLTYVWREDRVWAWDNYHSYKFQKFPMFNPLLWVQKRRVVKLFKFLRKEYPSAELTVTGFGTSYGFPNWIEDLRFADYTDENHIRLCEIYAESRMVFGIHGADMVLPSAHAGLMFDLIPTFKWTNYAEDIILRKDDPYFSIYRFQFLPASIKPKELYKISRDMLNNMERYVEHKIDVPKNYI